MAMTMTLRREIWRISTMMKAMEPKTGGVMRAMVPAVATSPAAIKRS